MRQLELGNAMNVTVVLCTYNRCESLAKALESVAGSVAPSSMHWDVQVVDNNSRDETREVVERFCHRFPGRFNYVFEPKQGKSYALNTGIGKASGDLIAFMDDDVEVDPLWLYNLTAPLNRGEWAGAGGRIFRRRASCRSVGWTSADETGWHPWPCLTWVRIRVSLESLPSVQIWCLGRRCFRNMASSAPIWAHSRDRKFAMRIQNSARACWRRANTFGTNLRLSSTMRLLEQGCAENTFKPGGLIRLVRIFANREHRRTRDGVSREFPSICCVELRFGACGG